MAGRIGGTKRRAHLPEGAETPFLLFWKSGHWKSGHFSHTKCNTKHDHLPRQARDNRNESSPKNRLRLIYTQEMVGKKDEQIVALKRQLEANGLVANLG